jgi:hypothetical protein
VTNLALEYAAAAAGIGAAGAILLLILGTQVMDWYWPVALFAAALAAGLYRARRKRLSRYALAQTVDARLELQDRLSTFVYFRESGKAPDSLSMVEAQAEERLRVEDMDRAMPVQFPKYGYACAALVMAAGGLLGLRYGILHTLDLAPPLARIDLGAFQPPPPVHAATKKTAIQERWDEQLKELGLTPEDLEIPNEKGLQPIESNVPGAPEAGAPPAEQNGKQNASSPQAPQSSPEGGENGEKSQGDAENAGEDPGSQQAGQANKQQPPPKNAKAGQPGSQDGLMNKMRDALANLMNKMKSPSNPQDQQGASPNSSQQAQMGKQQQSAQQGAQSQGKQQGEGSPDQDGEASDQASDKMPGDKSKSGDKSADRPGSQDSKSGMGQQDGEKAIREAQQLAAMGKISEIFGKRAQQLTGEMTVEVSSGKQQLKTAWSERKALHADTGAEVNRDEIPLAYQSYIQRYFEEVRKTPAKAKRESTP